MPKHVPEPPIAGPRRARWVDVQTVFVPDQGIVAYGDEIWVSSEQLDTPEHPTVPWSDDWAPDTAIAAQAAQEG